MKAVILAGGKGTRLAHLTTTLPKPMLEIGGRPVLHHQIVLLKRYGISDVIILVNHLKDSIIEYFGDGAKFDMNISYFEEPEPLGTVGGIKEIEEQLQEDFLVLYGDVMIDMHLRKFITFHKNKGSECTLAVHPNDHPYDSDLLDMDQDEKVTSFFPKPHEDGKYYRNLVNAAAYILSPSVFPFLEKGKSADWGKHIFPKLVSELKLYAYNTTEYLKDMGTPDRLEKVNKDFLSGKIARMNYEHKRKAIFLDRDGVLNYDTDLIKTPEELKLYPYTPEVIKKINQSEYIAIVITNQSVVARNLCTEEELRVILNKLETELGIKGAKLDAIYYCPHHPDSGFPGENPAYKIVCDCRKPKPGMILQAAEKFNIDLRNSFMIGDSARDIEAGKAAGCTAIGLMTGHGVKNSAKRGDFFFDNLKSAIDFILDNPRKQILERIVSKVENHSGKIIIGIGGNSRSGKSTLSSQLQLKLNEKSKKVLRINLDDWILNKEDRNPSNTSLQNFPLKKIETDLKKILSGERVTLKAYRVHQDESNREVSYQRKNEDVIIIEGVVAFRTENIRNHFDYSYFKKIENKTLKNRLFDFYRWKGKSENELEELWLNRYENEYKLIEKDAIFADEII